MEKVNTWFIYIAIFGFLTIAWYRNGPADRMKSDIIDSEIHINQHGAVPAMVPAEETEDFWQLT